MIKGVLAVSLASLLVLAGVARADQGTEWIPPLDAVARDKGEMAFDGCRPKPERIDPDRKSTRLNSSHLKLSRMPSSA